MTFRPQSSIRRRWYGVRPTHSGGRDAERITSKSKSRIRRRSTIRPLNWRARIKKKEEFNMKEIRKERSRRSPCRSGCRRNHGTGGGPVGRITNLIYRRPSPEYTAVMRHERESTGKRGEGRRRQGRARLRSEKFRRSALERACRLSKRERTSIERKKKKRG